MCIEEEFQPIVKKSKVSACENWGRKTNQAHSTKKIKTFVIRSDITQSLQVL